MESLDSALLRAHRYLSGSGWMSEALDLSVEVLGPAPQSLDPVRRVELLARLRVFMLDHGMTVETLAMFDRR